MAIANPPIDMPPMKYGNAKWGGCILFNIALQALSEQPADSFSPRDAFPAGEFIDIGFGFRVAMEDHPDRVQLSGIHN